MAVLAAQSVTAVAGKVLAFTAAAAGDRAITGANVFLVVRNGGVGATTVTLDTTGVAFNGIAIPDTAVVIAAGGQAIIPLTNDYRSSVDGMAGIAYSVLTTVTVAVISA